MRIALYQPDIAGNTGTILRLAACLGIAVDIIEPCGFPFSDRSLKRAGMDYAGQVDVTRHSDWAGFRDAAPGRIVLLSTHAPQSLFESSFVPGDSLLMGRESAGVPDDVAAQCDFAVRIPLVAGVRSLNVAVAAGIAAAEALRQTKGLPA